MLRRSGQSIVEYIVLLALVAIIGAAVVASVGQRSRSRIAQANGSTDEAAITLATATSAKPAVRSIAGKSAGGHRQDATE